MKWEEKQRRDEAFARPRAKRGLESELQRGTVAQLESPQRKIIAQRSNQLSPSETLQA